MYETHALYEKLLCMGTLLCMKTTTDTQQRVPVRQPIIPAASANQNVTIPIIPAASANQNVTIPIILAASAHQNVAILQMNKRSKLH